MHHYHTNVRTKKMVSRGLNEPIKTRYFNFRNYVIAVLFGLARVLGDDVDKPIIIHAATSLTESFFMLLLFYFICLLF